MRCRRDCVADACRQINTMPLLRASTALCSAAVSLDESAETGENAMPSLKYGTLIDNALPHPDGVGCRPHARTSGVPSRGGGTHPVELIEALVVVSNACPNCERAKKMIIEERGDPQIRS